MFQVLTVSQLVLIGDSRSAVASRYDSLTYESSSSETFNIDYYETVSWSVEFYKYE
jgi:hypothetical protein